ncbi:MAG: hypothetical protein ABEJ28_01955 [Salinigranum sp.]
METVYLGADGDTYSESDVWARYESGAWRFCMGDAADGRELVERSDGRLLMLTPLEPTTRWFDRGRTDGTSPRAADGGAGGDDPSSLDPSE